MFKLAKNQKCNSLTKKAKRNFFKEATNFWRNKPFLTNNNCISNDFIGIENDGNLISNEQELAKLCNEHYINKGNSSDASQDEITVKEIISVSSNYPSIWKTKYLCVPENKSDLPNASKCDFKKVIKSLNANKAKGPDGISAKFVKISANVIGYHLAKILISLHKYSKHAKKRWQNKNKKLSPCKSFKYFIENLEMYERFVYFFKNSFKISLEIYFRLSLVL